MLSIISSAKTLDFGNITLAVQPSTILFPKITKYLVTQCTSYSAAQLESLMKISANLAQINLLRFQNFEQQPQKSAIFAYAGDAYNHIKSQEYNPEQISFLQTHLLIVSGLYGLLRPLDLIKPYRLEMSTNLPETGNLTNFWQKEIITYINKTLAEHKYQYLINLASREYFSAIDVKVLKYPVIHIHFKENKNGKLQTIGINAKKARGSMVNFIGKHFVDSPETLKNFHGLNYRFSASESSNNNWVFIRD